MTNGDGEPLELAGRLWPTFTARSVALPAGSSVAYDEMAWGDALIVVRSGRIELETAGGARRTFGPGDILFFTGLGLRWLHNRDTESVVLQVISRTEPRRDKDCR